MNISVYKFLKLKHNSEGLFFEKYAITRRSLAVLEFLIIQKYANKELTVSEIMAISKLGSPAAIFKSLKCLRESRLLIFLNKNNNLRSKYPTLTVEAVKFFDDISWDFS
jgi:hypothetical protein